MHSTLLSECMNCKPLFLEIGTEEIPSRFIVRALEDLQKLARDTLVGNRIPSGKMRVFGTPRRLVLLVEDVANLQAPLEERVVGPAKSVAMDLSGNPTKAAMGFAKGQGVDVDSLFTIETEKGEYVAALRKEEGSKAEEILPSLLVEMISKLGFPKSMRWGKGTFRFVRPIHWIVALHGECLIPFEIDGIQSGIYSRGHRFMAPEEFEVTGKDSYVDAARKRYVVVDFKERMALISQLCQAAASEVGGMILEDTDLLEEVTGLVEYPTPVLGQVEEDYLDLPREVLITAMKHHQRYFSVVDKDGDLLPNFVAVSNIKPDETEIIRSGNERVLRARLADANYFYREDRKRPLEDYVESLKSVIFQKDLGSSFEKVERIVLLARWLADSLCPETTESTVRAAWLCKADLETQMVCEFPELQGIMGREYALIGGEDETVCRAIDEHYMPRGADDEYPSAGPSSFVSIADKLDTIVGYVGLGNLPTGSEDPYALRRAARGVLGVLLKHNYRLDIGELAQIAAESLPQQINQSQPGLLADKTWDFLVSRLENLFLASGYRIDLVRSVLGARLGSRDVVDVRNRLDALTEISSDLDFEPLTTTFKRVMNIVPDAEVPSVDSKYLNDAAEVLLYEIYLERAENISSLLEGENYTSALREIAGLRGHVDKFFSEVLVMDEDETLRNNRLGLLSEIGHLFSKIADFTKIVST